jgi:F-type H+-transporting ATPase subunit delta
MTAGAVARRYAKALFELAREDGRASEARGELGALADLLDESAELHAVLLQPLHPAAQRRAVLDAVSERLGTSALLRHFCAVLIEQRRLVDLAAIRAEYDRLADLEAGRMRAEVVSATPLRDEQLAKLREALAARVGRELDVEVRVDPELLGGVVAKVGDLLFDGSLRTQLRQLRAGLVRS